MIFIIQIVYIIIKHHFVNSVKMDILLMKIYI